MRPYPTLPGGVNGSENDCIGTGGSHPQISPPHTPTHTHTPRPNTGRRRGDRTQTGTRTSRHHRRITLHRTTSPNTSRPSTHPRTIPRAARQTPRSPTSAISHAGRPLRRARRRQGWRHAPGTAHEVSELGHVRQVLHPLGCTRCGGLSRMAARGTPMKEIRLRRWRAISLAMTAERERRSRAMKKARADRAPMRRHRNATDALPGHQR